MSEKEKERAKDLMNVSVFSENMAVELLSITATEYNAALLLKARDNRGKPLLDVLIENEQVVFISSFLREKVFSEGSRVLCLGTALPDGDLDSQGGLVVREDRGLLSICSHLSTGLVLFLLAVG